MRVAVARVADFLPGQRRIIQIGKRSIGVFRVGDRFYAINNSCPHQSGPLCLGRTVPWARSDGPGDVRVTGERTLLACPWHGWEYDLVTGQSFLGPGERPARSYEVSVRPGQDLNEDAALKFPDRVPGPYVAETFTVSVEEDYVVVDTRARSDR
ncbi:Rieske (2Fe-2S) protein [Saccharomonospora sp. NPDC046836]|uniref:Rieske (2Fe-2S) protein n=1 Tax=Saccharomonospora sp. NPDC046836 TaxID=3156921 RepID=UPI0033FF0D26